MQTYDCSYEQAEHHFQLLGQGERAHSQLDRPSANEAENGEELSH